MNNEELEIIDLYGISAEFTEPEQLIAAAKAARAKGYRKMDAYTPYPVHGLDEAMSFHDMRIPWMIFFGAIFGACAGYGLQYYINVIDYPLNIGGRPYQSWPSFIPVTFECTILFAALTAVFGMLALNGLPQPWHPIFNAPNIERAGSDRFFLCIEAKDPLFDNEETRRFLDSLHPENVAGVSAGDTGVPAICRDIEETQGRYEI
jgi:hypothetical protein